MPPRFIARQLSRPSGLGGAFIRLVMNRTNAKLNELALAELNVQAGDRALEIGFGGGLTLERLLADAQHVCGVDCSADAVASASRQFAKDIERGAAEFIAGSIENLPLPPSSFDKVLTVNTVYFWASLEEGARELSRVLRPGGRVVIGFVPKSVMDRMNMPPDIFSPREPEEIVAALRGAGFTVAKIVVPNGPDRAMLAVGETSPV
jgi:arsenite methyltransferase